MNVSGDVMAIQSHVSQQIEAAQGGYAHAAYNLAKGAAQRVTGPYGK